MTLAVKKILRITARVLEIWWLELTEKMLKPQALWLCLIYWSLTEEGFDRVYIFSIGLLTICHHTNRAYKMPKRVKQQVWNLVRLTNKVRPLLNMHVQNYGHGIARETEKYYEANTYTFTGYTCTLKTTINLRFSSSAFSQLSAVKKLSSKCFWSKE